MLRDDGMDPRMLPHLLCGPHPTDLMTSSSGQGSGRSRAWDSPFSWEVVCTGVVSEEDTVSAASSLKGLWRWVGLLVEALLLVGSEAVERGPLTVSVRSPSGRTGNRRQPIRHRLGPPKHALTHEGGR